MVFGIIGIVLFLYLNWRNLRDNYKSEELISYSWLALLTFFAGGRLAYGLLNWGVWNDDISKWFHFTVNKGFNFVGGYIFLLLTSYFLAGYRGWKVWSLGEDCIENFLVFVLFVFTGGLVFSNLKKEEILIWIILLMSIFVVNWIKRKYRSFVWYKSGKKGFVFLFANFFTMFFLSLISIFFKDGIITSYLYLGWSLISLFGLFILGDIWILKK